MPHTMPVDPYEDGPDDDYNQRALERRAFAPSGYGDEHDPNEDGPSRAIFVNQADLDRTWTRYPGIHPDF